MNGVEFVTTSIQIRGIHTRYKDIRSVIFKDRPKNLWIPPPFFIHTAVFIFWRTNFKRQFTKWIRSTLPLHGFLLPLPLSYDLQRVQSRLKQDGWNVQTFSSYEGHTPINTPNEPTSLKSSNWIKWANLDITGQVTRENPCHNGPQGIHF